MLNKKNTPLTPRRQVGLTAFHKFEDTKAAMEAPGVVLFFLQDDLFGWRENVGKDFFFLWVCKKMEWGDSNIVELRNMYLGKK